MIALPRQQVKRGWRHLRESSVLTLAGVMTIVAPLIALTAHVGVGGVTNHWVEEGVPFALATQAVIAAALWRICNTSDLRDAWAFVRRSPILPWVLLIGWSALTCALAHYKGFAVQGVIQMTSLLVIPSLVAYSGRHANQVRALLMVLCVAVVLSSLQSIVAVLQAEPAASVSPTIMHGLFGAVLALPLLLALATAGHSGRLRLLARIAAFLGVVALLVAHTQVCWAGVAVSMVVLGVLLRRQGLAASRSREDSRTVRRPFPQLEMGWVDNRKPTISHQGLEGSSRRRRRTRRSEQASLGADTMERGGSQAATPPRPPGLRRAGAVYSVLHVVTLAAAFVLFLFLSRTLVSALNAVNNAVSSVDVWMLRLRHGMTTAAADMNAHQSISFQSLVGSFAGFGRHVETVVTDYWQAPLHMIAARPLLGWGIGCYPLYQAAFTHVGRSAIIVNGYGPHTAEEAHNWYIKIAVELGIPGLVLWCGALFMVFALGLKNLHKPNLDPFRARMLIGCLAVLAGQAVDGFADPAWIYGRVATVSGLILGLTLVQCGLNRGLPTEHSPTRPEAGSWVMITQEGRYARFVAVCIGYAALMAVLVRAISD